MVVREVDAESRMRGLYARKYRGVLEGAVAVGEGDEAQTVEVRGAEGLGRHGESAIGNERVASRVVARGDDCRHPWR